MLLQLIISFLLFSFPTFALDDMQILTGDAIAPYYRDIKQLRVQYFSKFPYLYVSPSEEGEDISYYQGSEHTTMGISLQEDKILGLMIGLPLEDFKFQKDFLNVHQQLTKDLGEELKTTFYISELLISEDSEETFIKEVLLLTLEDKIKNNPRYSSLSVMTIERENNHPLKPINYEEESRLYQDHGFKDTGLTYSFEWPVFQADGSVKKKTDSMRLWINKFGYD